MDSDFKQNFNYFLDSERKNRIFVSFTYSADFLSTDEFVLIYLTKIDDSFKEVIKYDYSKREALHVHYFGKHARKEYLDLPPTIGTLFELKNNLVSNWHRYLLKFMEG